ncbi:MAG: class I SAM-dependent methyltransferase [Paracoccaceae bacterium]
MTRKTPDLSQAYNLQTPDDSKRLYAEWAASYDGDFVREKGYLLHLHVAQLFVQAGGSGPVLDVGAGTGICGASLRDLGVGPLDATDISAEMLVVAQQKDIYRDLFVADLLAGLTVPDDTYAGVVSSGTFTTGHVGPDGLDELLRVSMPGGLITISINSKHFTSAGFGEKIETIKGKNFDVTMTEVRIYDDAATGSHKDDTAFVTHLRKY